MAKAKVLEENENEELVDLEFEVESVESDHPENEGESSDLPTIEDPEWTDYVMSLLTKKEKVGDKPKALGLLRIAPVVFSDILNMEKEVHAVSPDYAAVTMKLEFENGCRFCGSAEVSQMNCGEPYNRFPLASASTRALGRVLKTALRLQVLTAEENNDIAVGSNEELEGSVIISDTQINFIEILCGPKKLNVNVQEAVSLIMGYEVECISKLTHDNALSIQEALDAWLKTSTEKPKLAEYDSGWRSNFA